MVSVPIEVVLEAVIVAVTQDEPRVLTVRPATDPEELPGLPSGALDVTQDRTLDRGLRRWVREQTGIDVGYVEQLYTFGDRFRSPSERQGGPRVLSIAYLALVREERPSAGAAWQPWYDLLPWEDHRHGEPQVIGRIIRPAIDRWIGAAVTNEERSQRAERAAVTFGTEDGAWDPVRALERYELLYHLDLLEESRGPTAPTQLDGTDGVVPGHPMVLDHRRIVATALARLRGKITYRPVVFELLPEAFTLLALQTLVEALAGEVRHKQNFRRLVERGGLVEPTGQTARSSGGGRPAKLYRFRRDVVRERPRPGVGLPARG
jgi:hypothetical protein